MMMEQPDQPRRKALVDALSGGTATASAPPMQAGAPAPAMSGSLGGFSGGAVTRALQSMQPPSPAAGFAPAPEAPMGAPIQRQTWTRANVLDAVDDYAPTREGLDQAIAANPWLGKQVGNQGGKIQDPQTGEIWDVIGNLASGNGHHQVLTGHTAKANGGGAPAAGGAATSMPQAGGGIAAMLGSNPLANSQAALQGVGGFANSGLLQQLIQQLSGGR